MGMSSGQSATRAGDPCQGGHYAQKSEGTGEANSQGKQAGGTGDEQEAKATN